VTTTTQTWWLSFCDPDRPTGEQFLGVVIVDVTEADVVAATPSVTARRAQFGLPPFAPDAWELWMAAAVRLTHYWACNPGGEVASLRIDDAPEFPARDAQLPRNRLLTKPELDALELV